jgi:metal-dependent hydrolase (beta-lactamase superfamily II)
MKFPKLYASTWPPEADAGHFSEAELSGRLVPNQHPDEHATCYVVQGRGLVVISSCGHAGLINTILTAMAVSGVDKLHAVLGGFHPERQMPRYRDLTSSLAHSSCGPEE